MEYDENNVPGEVEGDHHHFNNVKWNDCDSSNNSQNVKENKVKTSGDAKRILNEAAIDARMSPNPKSNKGKFITLKKTKDMDNVQIRPFDDGLYFKFDKLIKPKHISFYCKTDNADVESCNFRVFEVNTVRTRW